MERALAPFALIACLLGLVTGAIDAVAKVGELLAAQRFLTMSALWIGMILIIWKGFPSHTRVFGFSRSTIRALTIALATALLGFAGIYPQLRDRWSNEGPAQIPDLIPAGQLFGRSAHAEGVSRLFSIERLYVNDELSSFEERSDFDLSRVQIQGTPRIRTFAYNERVKAARENGRCIGPAGDRPIVNVLPLLQERLRKTNRPELQSLVENIDSYRRMMSSAGQRFSEVLFTQVEVDRIRLSDPAAFRIITRWLIDCVGVQNPVLTIEVRNSSSVSVLLTDIEYVVEEVYIVLGGESGPLTPAYTYDHLLPYARGVHQQRLVPPFLIAPHSLGAFNIVLRSASDGAGRTWVMRVRLRESTGKTAFSDKFQLIMSKLE